MTKRTKYLLRNACLLNSILYAKKVCLVYPIRESKEAAVAFVLSSLYMIKYLYYDNYDTIVMIPKLPRESWSHYNYRCSCKKAEARKLNG